MHLFIAVSVIRGQFWLRFSRVKRQNSTVDIGYKTNCTINILQHRNRNLDQVMLICFIASNNTPDIDQDWITDLILIYYKYGRFIANYFSSCNLLRKINFYYKVIVWELWNPFISKKELLLYCHYHNR